MQIGNFSRRTRIRQVQRLANWIAERSAEEIAARVGLGALGMGLDETRGFARALAGKTIRRVTDDVLRQVGGRAAQIAALRAQLLVQATDLAVETAAQNIYRNPRRGNLLRIAG